MTLVGEGRKFKWDLTEEKEKYSELFLLQSKSL